jgi:hypothetical protein
MRKAKQLLSAFTARYPPPIGAKHALLVGHNDQLHLVFAKPDGAFQHIVFQDEDLDSSVEQILEEVATLLEAEKKP